MTVEPAAIRAAPGSNGEVVLAVTNNSDTVGKFTVELDDRSVGWIRVEPPSQNIYPRDRQLFRILVQPPRTSACAPGSSSTG